MASEIHVLKYNCVALVQELAQSKQQPRLLEEVMSDLGLKG